ncbi:MAG: penicillin acylase family protein, partial [Verrucomicrobiota bacterium]
RIAAGEIAEIIPQGIETDRKNRVHQFRKRARSILDSLKPEERDLLEKYTAGVNSGIQQLSSRPFEYHLLQVSPRLWRTEDSILCAISITMALQDIDALTDRVRGQISAHFPPEIFDFIYQNGSRWEAPQDGSIREIIPPPPAESWQAATSHWPETPESPNWMPKPSRFGESYPRESYRNGSNNWAAQPSKDAPNPAAWVANDMHLGLRIPNTWYRATVFEQSRSGEPLEAHGVSLPGLPGIIVGGNGKIAWGFTNPNADTEDAIILIADPEDPEAYLTSEGSEKIKKEIENLYIKGAPQETITVETTPFGPVIGKNESGQKIAFQWVAHQDWSFDLQLLNLAKSTSAQEALEIANTAESPALSMVVGDDQGNIGWTLFGSIPDRTSSELQLTPIASNEPSALWKGRLAPGAYPRIYNPEQGFITTANARIVGGDALVRFGDSGYLLGSRQWRIQQELATRNAEHSLESMLEIQMNIEGDALYPWQALIRWAYSPIRGSLTEEESELMEWVNAWSGRAEASSVGYRIIRSFRGKMLDRLYYRLLGPVLAKDASIYYNRGFARLGIPFEEPMLQILELRPDALIDPYFNSWHTEMRYALAQIIEEAKPRGFAKYTWGAVNKLSIKHPMSAGIPVLGDWINMPEVELDGDQIVINANAPDHGPSQRFVVQVGDERNGRFSMPAGQSGHPLSPFYRAGHEAWLKGAESPLRPGDVLHTLTLVPEE